MRRGYDPFNGNGIPAEYWVFSDEYRRAQTVFADNRQKIERLDMSVTPLCSRCGNPRPRGHKQMCDDCRNGILRWEDPPPEDNGIQLQLEGQFALD